jgi:hypothetical protein
MFALATPQGIAQRADQRDVLWWLPPDTESVVAARGPFPVRIRTNELDAKGEREWFTKKASQAAIRTEFEQLPLELFHSLDLATALRGFTVAFSMQGSRHFRNPLPGSEVMEYEGCSIVIFEKELDALGANLVRTMGRKATDRQIIAGTQVLIFREKSEQAEWTYFLALPQPNVLLVANDRGYLQEVLERMRQRTTVRALPDQLPEWGFLDPTAQFWGLRHYDRSQAKQDPTSPFSEDRTFGPGDPKAIGVLFSLDPKSARSAVITSFSGDETRVRNTASAGVSISQPQDGVKYDVRLRSPKPGVLEQIVTLDRSSNAGLFRVDSAGSTWARHVFLGYGGRPETFSLAASLVPDPGADRRAVRSGWPFPLPIPSLIRSPIRSLWLPFSGPDSRPPSLG